MDAGDHGLSQLTTRKGRLRIGPGSTGRLMTTAQFDALRPEQCVRGYRYELINRVLAAGVEEYWVIDRFRRIMTVYRRSVAGPTYDIVTEAQTYQTDLLPGFVLPLVRLLATADQWKRNRVRTKPRRKPDAPAGGTDG